MKICITSSGTEVFLNGNKLDLNESLKVVNHSPAGFNWGYGGSGPAQLALSICLNLFGKTRALKVYKKFKWDYVSKWEQNQPLDYEIDITDFYLDTISKRLVSDENAVIDLKWVQDCSFSLGSFIDIFPDQILKSDMIITICQVLIDHFNPDNPFHSKGKKQVYHLLHVLISIFRNIYKLYERKLKDNPNNEDYIESRYLVGDIITALDHILNDYYIYKEYEICLID